MQIAQIIFLLLFPYLTLKLSSISRKLDFLSPILICYLAGALLGNMKFIPLDRALSISVSEIAVPLAIPLILFSTDFGSWFRMAGKTVLSFCLVIISVILASLLGAVFFSGTVGEYWKLSGMLVGLYTGGTPNLMAIGLGVGVNEETLVLANTSDALLGGVYYLFLITGAKWLFGKLLPPFKGAIEPLSRMGTGMGEGKATLAGKMGALVLSALITGLSVGLSVLFYGRMEVALIMLAVTTFGIAASLVRRVRLLKGTYDMGQYAILIFSLAMGMSIDISKLTSSTPSIFIYTLFVMLAALAIHLLLAAIFRIDTDTTIITSTAGIYGPAFIGPVASALKNREVVISGLTSGLVGYAVGNYLGFIVAWLLAPK